MSVINGRPGYMLRAERLGREGNLGATVTYAASRRILASTTAHAAEPEPDDPVLRRGMAVDSVIAASALLESSRELLTHAQIHLQVSVSRCLATRERIAASRAQLKAFDRY